MDVLEEEDQEEEDVVVEVAVEDRTLDLIRNKMILRII
jgi:hypothetical protein